MYCSDETVKHIDKPTSSSYGKNLSEVVVFQREPVKRPEASRHVETYSISVESKEEAKQSKSPYSLSKKAFMEATKKEYSLPSESLTRHPDTPHMEAFSEDVNRKGYAMDKGHVLESSLKLLSFMKHPFKMDEASGAKISLDMCEKEMARHPERKSSSARTPGTSGTEETFLRFSSKVESAQSSQLAHTSTAVTSIKASTVTPTPEAQKPVTLYGGSSESVSSQSVEEESLQQSIMSTFEISERDTQVVSTSPHGIQSLSEEYQPEKDNTFGMSYLSESYTLVKGRLPKERLQKSVLDISQQKPPQTKNPSTSASFSADTGAKEFYQALHFPDHTQVSEPFRENCTKEIIPSSQQKGLVKQALTTPDSPVLNILKLDQESSIQQIPGSNISDISKQATFDSKESQSHTTWLAPSQVLESFSGRSYKETYVLPKPMEASQQTHPSEPVSDFLQKSSDTSDLSYCIESGFQQLIDKPGQKSEMVVEKTLMKMLPSGDSGVSQERTFSDKSIVAIAKSVQEGPSDDADAESDSKDDGWPDKVQVSKAVLGKSITMISQSSQQDGNVQQQIASVAKSIVSVSGKTFPQQTMHYEASVAHRELQTQTDSVISSLTGYSPQISRDGQQTVTSGTSKNLDLHHDVHSVERSKGRSSIDISLHEDIETQKQISVMPDRVRKKELQWEDSPKQIHASDSYTEDKSSQGSASQLCTPPDKLSTNLKSEIANLSVKANDMAQFTCKFDDSDLTEILWYHNGTKLINTDRVRLTQNDGEVTLTIWNVQPEDQGTYNCMVKNRQGEGRTSAQLTVEGGYSFKENSHYISSLLIPFHSMNPMSNILLLVKYMQLFHLRHLHFSSLFFNLNYGLFIKMCSFDCWLTQRTQ